MGGGGGIPPTHPPGYRLIGGIIDLAQGILLMQMKPTFG